MRENLEGGNLSFGVGNPRAPHPLYETLQRGGGGLMREEGGRNHGILWYKCLNFPVME